MSGNLAPVRFLCVLLISWHSGGRRPTDTCSTGLLEESLDGWSGDVAEPASSQSLDGPRGTLPLIHPSHECVEGAWRSAAASEDGSLSLLGLLAKIKCSICSYQLNIWYAPKGAQILNWFLELVCGSEACFTPDTGCPGIAVPPWMAHTHQCFK